MCLFQSINFISKNYTISKEIKKINNKKIILEFYGNNPIIVSKLKQLIKK